jgi:hypothetical protein
MTFRRISDAIALEGETPGKIAGPPALKAGLRRVYVKKSLNDGLQRVI